MHSLREMMQSFRASPVFVLAVLLTLGAAGVVGLMVVIMQFQPGFLGMAHFTDPRHRTHDLTFGFLFGVAGVGLLAQFRRPSRNVAGMVMALIPWAGLLLAGILSTEVFRVVLINPSRVVAPAVVITALLHPTGRHFFRSFSVSRVNWMMLALVVIAAVPLLAYAATNIGLQATIPDDHAAQGHYGYMAAFAFTVVGVGLLASLRPDGWWLPAWVAGLLPVLLGITSLVLPDNSSSLSLAWAIAAIAWGVVFIAAAELTQSAEIPTLLGARGIIPTLRGPRRVPSEDDAHMRPDRGPATRTPGWVTVVRVIALVPVLLIFINTVNTITGGGIGLGGLVGIGGGGPGGHTPPGGAAGPGLHAPPGSGEPANVAPTSADILVYSMRGEELVGQVIERFQQETGIEVEVRYGGPAELGAILARDSNAPADVYLGPNPFGVIGSGRLRKLPDRILTRVDEQFRSTGGEWVGVTGRARVVVYNTDRVSEDELPDSILGFTDPAWEGRLGWAPINGSFQDFMAALRIIEGEEGARDWLAGIQANQPMVWPPGSDNARIVEAVAAGEVDAGFVNSYYLPQLCSSGSRAEKVGVKYYTDSGPGAVIHVSIGAGIFDTSGNVPAAERFIEFLLENESQRTFVQVCELPLVNGVLEESDGLLFNLASLRQPDLNLTRLEDEKEGSQALITEVTGLDPSGRGHSATQDIAEPTAPPANEVPAPAQDPGDGTPAGEPDVTSR